MQVKMRELENLRAQIEEIDSQITTLLRLRAKKVQEIGDIKREHKLPVQDPKREKEILQSLESPYEKSIYEKIIAESRKLQK